MKSVKDSSIALDFNSWGNYLWSAEITFKVFAFPFQLVNILSHGGSLTGFEGSQCGLVCLLQRQCIPVRFLIP